MGHRTLVDPPEVWELSDAGRPNPDTTARFAATLDAFLGRPQERPYPVEEWPEGYLTWLPGLAAESTLPVLAVAGERGVPLWFPTEPAGGMPTGLQAHGPVLAFAVTQRPRAARGVPRFDARLLLCHAPPGVSRRMNFLRALGSELEVRSALPLKAAPKLEVRLSPQALAVRASGLLDMLDWTLEGAATDLLAWCCGDRSALLYALLRALPDSGVRPREPLNIDDVMVAWRSAQFRDAARELLLPVFSSALTKSIVEAVQISAEGQGALRWRTS